MNELNWKLASYEQLTVDDLHDLLALRIEIFVVEQDCPYQEVDGKDRLAHHLWARNGAGEMVACIRILPPGVAFSKSEDVAKCAIGRVVVKVNNRGTGLGHELMKRGLSAVEELFGPVPIKISAQEHLQTYYARHGFRAVGESYLEDGIPHVAMVFKRS